MSILPEISAAAVLLAINTTLVGAVVALSIAAAFWLTQNAHPRIRYVIAISAFFLSILLPFWMTFDSNKKRETPLVFVAENAISDSRAEQPREASPSQIESPNLFLPQTAPVPIGNSTDYFSKFIIALRLSIGWLILWAAVSVLLIGREILGYAFLANRRRKWRRVDFKTLDKIEFSPDGTPLYLSESEGPFVVGIFRRAVVFPARLLADLPTESIRSILRHELNHVRWRDPSLNAVLRLMRAVFWFCPPLWYLERVARLEREAAADFAAIVSRRNESDFKAAAADYATALMTVAHWSAGSINKPYFDITATEVGNQTYLERRVRRLLKSSEKAIRWRLVFAGFILSAGIFGAAFLPVASQSLPIVSDNRAMSEVDNFTRHTRNQPARSGYSILETEQSKKDAGIVSMNQTIQRVDERNPFEATGLTQGGNENSPIVSPMVADIDQESVSTVQTRGQNVPQNFETGTNFLRDAMAEVGYPDLSEAELTTLRNVGANHFYVRELASAGYTNLPLKTLIDLRRQGVSAAYIQAMAAEGYDNLTAELLIDFRRQGVSPVYIREMRSQGYRNLSPQMLRDFKRNAVSTAYIEELAALGYRNLPARTILEFREQAVISTFIKKLRETVNSNISANELVDMRKQAVTTKVY